MSKTANSSVVTYVNDSSSESDTSDSDSLIETNLNDEADYDEQIKAKEEAIEEVDSYIRKLQDRRNDLIEQCKNLKDRKYLRKSHQLAKQNWESDKYAWSEEVHKSLKTVFKLNSFRPQQDQLEAVVSNGITIVVSPLISLMEDQVWTLQRLGIEAEILCSTTSRSKINVILKMLADDASVLKLLYVTPERMAKSKRFMTALQKSFFAKKLNYIAIDEVHCCSQWGHDFRPDYKFLGTLKQMFPDVPILGVTATATSKVIVDVQKMLNIRDCLVLKAPFNRPNLFYQVLEKPGEKVEVYKMLTDLLKTRYAGKSGIIYTFSIKDAEDVAAELINKDIQARAYHASLTPERRKTVHLKWLKGQVQVIVATVAFGMGIDKPDVRFVIHHTMSKSIENFYQESGRAGRDGKPAECLLLFRLTDLAKVTTMMFSERTGLQNAYQMLAYCIDASRCRRRIISKYFSEVWKDSNCNKMCDHCHNVDTVAAPKIEITDYIFDLYKIIDGADGNLTMTKLVDAWYSKGSVNFRSNEVEIPSFDRSFAEQIIGFLIINRYLKEDFHFTAYNTISYIRKGSNTPNKHDVVYFQGAPFCKLHESEDTDIDDGSSHTTLDKNKNRKTPNVSTSERNSKSNVSILQKKRKLVSDTTPKSKKKVTNDVYDFTSTDATTSPSTSQTSYKLKAEKRRSAKTLNGKQSAKTQHSRTRGEETNKNGVEEDVIFITDENNVIEIED